ncbi:MAG: Ref family protein [Bacteroidales bacterium]|nr:Ref family protein [Candidatus Latescibacterota bacterium]
MKTSLPNATKAEKRRFKIMAEEIGCIACLMDNLGYNPPDIHHELSGGKRISHSHTIPLCPETHHKYGDISVHQGIRKFEEKYSTEEYLRELTNRAVADFESRTIGGVG